jgi:hypothetical protein
MLNFQVYITEKSVSMDKNPWARLARESHWTRLKPRRTLNDNLLWWSN